VQALVVKSGSPQPRRVVNGVDGSRVAMLLAVLEKRATLPSMGDQDVYVSTVGGMRLTEPGADLAIAIAIASAVKEFALPPTFAAIGEISLAGEIRKASNAKQRLSEAKRLGFSTVVDSEVLHIREAMRQAVTAAAGAGARERKLASVPNF
jgi:DNA repair protein RadA/Sms